MPSISLIIPVYNVERYLRRCLDSVLVQTYGDWEAICVNDGSTDGSLSILQEYAQQVSRFKVIDKPNGGQSDARNVGLEHFTGEYLIYLDADDFIHPQTLEIAHTLAVREGSDMVSWYKDPYYRPKLILRHKLGLEVDHVIPRSYRHHYDIDHIAYYTSDDIFAHVTEAPPREIKWPVKHFYPVMHLFKRETVQSVKFVKGIIFEDFPWFSELILSNPRVTITGLPLYYYFPNFTSTDLSSHRDEKILNWLTGLEYIWSIYQERATPYQLSQWSRNCMWPAIRYHLSNKVYRIQSPAVRYKVRERLQLLWLEGTFDNPPGRSFKSARRRLRQFIQLEE